MVIRIKHYSDVDSRSSSFYHADEMISSVVGRVYIDDSCLPT